MHETEIDIRKYSLAAMPLVLRLRSARRDHPSIRIFALHKQLIAAHRDVRRDVGAFVHEGVNILVDLVTLGQTTSAAR